MRLYIFILLLLMMGSQELRANEKFIQAPVAIQMSSTISDGNLSLSDIILTARNKGIKVVVLTDKDFQKWEYGVWPLRKIIYRRVEMGSASTYGFGRYLDEIKKAREANPDMVIIPGVESAPFYYWEGNPFWGEFKLKNWHKHLLVIGLEKEEDYKHLPSVANTSRLSDFTYDQYHGDQGVFPYQNLIDYVNQRGGLVFWAHPDIENMTQRGKVKIETPEHSLDLLRAKDFSGFAVFYEGYKNTGKPGGIWDQILKEYCEGKRSSPIWAIGALAFDQPGAMSLGELMQDLRTVVFVPELNKTEILKALKEGRMYAVKGVGRVALDKFEVELKEKPIVKISGGREDGKSDPVEIDLIRGGEIIKTFATACPFEIDHQDDYFEKDKISYYRIEINYPGGQLISNPLFVKLK